MSLQGPMFERDSEVFKSVHGKEGAHYNTYSTDGEYAMAELHRWFPEGKANEMNFVLFSTSGVHGSYCTIEYCESENMPVTFLIVQPRIVCLRYGNVKPDTNEDWLFLKKLRQSSWEVVQEIGKVETEAE